MEQEFFFSGYCRQLDASRMVAVFVANGEIDEVDCQYGTCPHAPNCLIAKQIDELTE